MLNKLSLPLLHRGKNLLAFSGGVDSSALFFLLLKENIPFDIAIVNYQVRNASTLEVAYAQKLAKEHNKKCFLLETKLSSENFEAQARRVRYDFFEQLIQDHHYTNLLTGHQLNDRLEWFLMQLSKGAGLYELLGSQIVEEREEYKLLRPLLETTRTDIYEYLHAQEIHYFEDASNSEEHYKRNFFRNQLSNQLLQAYPKGIQKSFTYLNEDLQELLDAEPVIEHIEALYFFKIPNSRRTAVICIDRVLKELGFLMRQGDKEALKIVDEHVVGRRYVVAFTNTLCFIAPYATTKMPKAFKESCRLLKIPQKLRPYLFEHPFVFEDITTQLRKQSI